ncbi:MAG: tetratricopeptide repeat protein, partial [Myxococcota bacterium]
RDPEFAEAHANLGLLLMRAELDEEARPHLEKTLALGLDTADVHVALATLAMRGGECETAIRHFREALRLKPGMRRAANNLAWLLATTPRESLRDPDQAIRIAETMLGSWDSENPALLDTLATGYAAAGRFEDAIRTAREAIGRWPAANDDARKEVEARLALYRAHRAYVAPLPHLQGRRPRK